MTLTELAKISGVSVSTASKVLNGKDSHITSETRQKVLQAAKQIGYNLNDRQNGKNFVLGLLLNDNYFNSLILKGISSGLQQEGYSILLKNIGNDQTLREKTLSFFSGAAVDGLIEINISDENIGPEELLSDKISPYIRFDLIKDPDLYPKIIIDAIQTATDKLTALGHNKIALLTSKGNPLNNIFEEGIQKALYRQNAPVANVIFLYSIRELMLSLSGNAVTAVICAQDEMRSELYYNVVRHKYIVPKDISILSIPQSGEINGFLSEVTPDFFKMGQFMARRAVSICEKRNDVFPIYKPYVSVSSDVSIGIPEHSKQAGIVVVGSINIDTILNVQEMPKAGKTLSTDRCSVTPGGKGMNEAIGIARLEHDVSLIGCVGNDIEADIIYDLLKTDMVDSVAVERNMTQKTGKAFIHLHDNTESAITVLSGANESLNSGIISKNESLFKHASFCLLQTEIPIEATKAAISLARANGVQTVLKPSISSEFNLELISNVDYFIPNIQEARLLCSGKASVEELADYFLCAGAGNVIITMDKDGGYFKNSSTEIRFEAKHLEIVDTTGGADAFIAAFAVYMSLGYALEQVLQIASYAAAFCISRQGVVPALVTRRTLEQHILHRQPELLSHPKP